MTILKILTYPNPILKKVSKPVDKVTGETKKLLDDMLETMYAGNGIGLAAPQVSINKRIIVIDISSSLYGAGAPVLQLINPEIIEAKDTIEWEEGCLSVPELTVVIERANKIKVIALNKDGKEIEIDAEDLLAIALQHEIDHLNGRLIIDRISRLKRDLYLKKTRKAEKL